MTQLFTDPAAQQWWDTFDKRLPTQQAAQEQPSMLEDIAAAPVRGVVGIASGAYGLLDTLTFDSLPDAPENFGLGGSQTIPGSLIENLTGFLIPFGAVSKGVSTAGKGVGLLGEFGKVGRAAAILKEESLLARAAGDLSKASQAARKAAFIERGAAVAESAIAGGITQAAFFPGKTGNLSSLIEGNPSLSNPISEFLATDADTPELVGRLKNGLEGMLLGGMIDSVIGSVRIYKAGVKAAAAGADVDAAMGAARIRIRREQTDAIQQSLPVDEKQAAVINAWFDATGLPRERLGGFTKGTPDGAPGAVAFTDFAEDGKAMVSFLEGADFSSAIHEHAHVLRRWTFNSEIPAKFRAGITDTDIRTLEHWAGVTDGKWTKSAEEKFAIGIESYLKDGKAPNYELAGMFRQASEFMANVAYNSDVKLSKPVRDILDKMVTRGSVEVADQSLPGAGRLYQTKVDLTGKPGGNPDAALNIPRVSSSDEAKTVVATAIETQLGKSVTAFESLDRETLELEAMSLLRDNGLLDPSTADQFAAGLQALSEGDLKGLAVRQHAIRTLQDSYARTLASDIAKVEAGAATDADLLKLLQMNQRFYAVTKANKEFSVASGQLQVFRKVIPSVSTEVKILGEDLVSDPKIAAGLIESAGGRDDLIAQIQQIKAALQSTDHLPEAIGKIHKIMDGQKTGRFNMVMEYWMNSILSGITTFAANATGDLFAMLYAPLEAGLGSAMLADWTGVKAAFSRYAGLFHTFGDSLRATKAFWKGESVGLLPGSKTFSTLTDSGVKNAISSAGAGVAPDSLLGATLDFIGPAINLPSKLLRNTDELFKQMNYRSMVYGELHRSALEQVKSGALAPNQVGAWIERQMEAVASRKQAYSESLIKSEASREAQKRIDAKVFKAGSPEHKEFFADYMQKNWDANIGEAATRGSDISQEATFSKALDRNRGFVEAFGARTASFVNETPLLRFFVPFITVPTRIALYAGQRLPTNALFAGIGDGVVGKEMPAVKKIALRLSEELASSNKAIRADAVGRMAMGSTIMGATFLSAWNGNITGGGPRDPELRKAAQLAGWQPYSIRIGDTYISYRRIEPFATLLGVAADIVESYRLADETNRPVLDATVSGIIGAVTNNISNKTYLQGIVNLANAISTPERYGGNFAKTFTASFIPSLLNQSKGIAFGDTELREIRTILDAVRNRIPMLSEGLDPRRNVLGEPIHGPEYFLPGLAGLAGMTTPFGLSSANKDPVKAEMARLNYGFANPKPVQSGVDLSMLEHKKGQSVYDRWLELTGSIKVGGKTLHQSLDRLVKSNAYQRLAESGDFEAGYESPRIPLIRREITRFRDAAWKSVIRENPALKSSERAYRQRNTALKMGKSIAEIQALGANS